MLTLNIDRLEGRIRYTLVQPGADRGAIAPMYETSLDGKTLRSFQRSADDFLRRSATEDISAQAKTKGAKLYKGLVPKGLYDRLRSVTEPLLISTDICGLPWEIFHDGEDFWCLRYALGKQILVTGHEPSEKPSKEISRKLRVLLIGSDPKGDLPFVHDEIKTIGDTLESNGVIVRSVAPDLATFDSVTDYLQEGFDFIHYAGHIGVDEKEEPGLLLARGELLSAAMIQKQMNECSLAFLNGCASGQREAEGTSGEREKTLKSVADGFLFGGAAGVVGTLCDVRDCHAASLAAEFYRRLLEGKPIGESLRMARFHSRATHPESATWLSFVLYGNPSLVLVREQVVELATGTSKESGTQTEAKTQTNQEEPREEPKPIGRIFAADGSLVESAWRSDTVELFARARAEALGRSEDSINLVDLIIALVGTPLFADAMAKIVQDASTTVNQVKRALRVKNKSGGPAAMVPRGPMRRRHFDRKTEKFLDAAGAARGSGKVGVRDLWRRVMNQVPPELDGIFDNLGLNRDALRQALQATGERTEPSISPKPPRANTRDITPEPKPIASGAAPAAPTWTTRLFDANGELRDRAVSFIVHQVLAKALGEARAVGDEAIEPLHILIALLSDPDVQRGIQMPAKERVLLSEARKPIYLLFGKKLVRPTRLKAPSRHDFSLAGFKVLQSAARRCASPLDWRALWNEVTRDVGPQLGSRLAASAGTKDPAVAKVVNLVTGTVECLEPDAIQKVVGRELSELCSRARHEHKVEVRLGAEIASWVALQAQKSDSTEREVIRIIDAWVDEPLRRALSERLNNVPIVRGFPVGDIVVFEAVAATQKPKPRRR